jgi:predicted dehydrogenase
MAELRFAMFGAHFWAPFQLGAWREFPDVRCVALYNRTISKAEKLAKEFSVPAVYGDAEELLCREKLDFVDICTDIPSHNRFTEMVARHKLPVICQKAMGPSLAVAQQMVKTCREAGVPFYIHENWRWQHPIRTFKKVLDQGSIGAPFRARLTMVSGYPVFVNEPALKDMEEFILWDMGTHILDVARFLFGEADRLYCQVHQIHQDIKGEDIATVIMHMGGRTTVTCELGYAENYLERECFPETFIFVEGDKGSVELAPNYWVRVTTKDGTHSRRCPPPNFKWANPDYLVVHSSMVPCIGNLLQALKGDGPAETTGEDNLKTMTLTSAAYDSARSGKTIEFAWPSESASEAA